MAVLENYVFSFVKISLPNCTFVPTTKYIVAQNVYFSLVLYVLRATTIFRLRLSNLTIHTRGSYMCFYILIVLITNKILTLRLNLIVYPV